MDVGKSLVFIDWGDDEGADVDAVFAQHDGDAGEDTDFVFDLKCDRVVEHRRRIYGFYLVEGRRRRELDRRGGCLGGPLDKRVRRDRLQR